MKNSIDFYKINSGIYGAINYNNMFPIVNSPDVFSYLEIQALPSRNPDDEAYKNLLKNQLTWLNLEENKAMVLKRVQNLYYKYMNNTLPQKIRSRCCDFRELEEHFCEFRN